MDWSAAMERHRDALKAVLVAIVAMAGLRLPPVGSDQSGQTGPSAADTGHEPDCPLPTADCRPEARAEGEPRRTLPRHLHRAVLRLLRPAESAARRLVIVAARALPPKPRPTIGETAAGRPKRRIPTPVFLKRPGGTGILLPRGFAEPGSDGAGARPAPRSLPFQLIDPPRRVRRRSTVPSIVPRISVPGATDLFPVPVRRQPAPFDRIDATRLSLRLAALAAALDDLPAQARRFRRWRARAASGARPHADPQAARLRRVWPMRLGLPPGQSFRNHRRPPHEVHFVLNDAHGLAFDALERPDTS